MPAELLPRVFDPFVQGGHGTDSAHGGLGLGLTIVRSLVQAHGGLVTAASDGPDRGSEFVMRVPALEAAAVARPAPIAPPRARRVRAGERVLVVDDNVDAAEMLADALSGAGYEVRVATDGLDAIAVARDFRPHAGLLDIGLPVLDGYELARRLREEHGAGLRLVAITGYGQASDRRRAHEAGFDEHVVKPVGLDLLLRVLAAEAIARPPI